MSITKLIKQSFRTLWGPEWPDRGMLSEHVEKETKTILNPRIENMANTMNINKNMRNTKAVQDQLSEYGLEPHACIVCSFRSNPLVFLCRYNLTSFGRRKVCKTVPC